MHNFEINGRLPEDLHMRIILQSIDVLAAILVTLFSLAMPCRIDAGIVFQETFDSGSATYGTDPYWQIPNQNNSLIVKSFDYPGTSITHDASGSGYFLFDGTGNIKVPSDQSRYYISPTFAVVPNTNYTISFFLTNMDLVNIASIQPEFDGVLVGSPVSAVGMFSTDGWQQFSFSWNSARNASGQLALNDFQLNSAGNDFGTDNIVVTASVPEPSPIILGTIAVLMGIGSWRSKRGRDRNGDGNAGGIPNRLR